jgi:hypothetical protein
MPNPLRVFASRILQTKFKKNRSLDLMGLCCAGWESKIVKGKCGGDLRWPDFMRTQLEVCGTDCTLTKFQEAIALYHKQLSCCVCLFACELNHMDYSTQKPQANKMSYIEIWTSRQYITAQLIISGRA